MVMRKKDNNIGLPVLVGRLTLDTKTKVIGETKRNIEVRVDDV